MNGDHENDQQTALSRRELLKAAVALTVMSGIPRTMHATPVHDMQYRELGRTTEKVSLVGLGGAHIGIQDEEAESIRIIRAAIDKGINFLDNSWDYSNGESEIRMGKALRDGYRKKVFLMTKIDGRTGPAAEKQLHESLKRLRTDTIDLLQFHEIIRESDPDRIFAPNGAFEAVLAAKQAGKVRYIGFTGHKSPAIHLKMLNVAFDHGFVFDAVQMPLNLMDAHFDSFEKNVLSVLLEHRIGVLGMKPLGDGILLRSGTVTAEECLQYVMNLPVSTVITGCDSMERVEQAVRVASEFKPLRYERVAALLQKTRTAAKNGAYERYKTSDDFDSTARHVEWLG